MAGETLPPVVAVLQGDISDLVSKVATAKKEVRSMDDVTGTAHVNVDQTFSFDSDLAAATAEVEAFGKLSPTAHLKVDSSSLSMLAIGIQHSLEQALAGSVLGGGGGSGSGGLAGAALAAGAGGGGLLGKVPGGALGGLGIGAGVFALLASLPAAIGLLGGLAAAFSAAGLAAGAFGAVAFTAVTAALAGGAGMDPWLAHLRTQLLNAETVFSNFWDKMTKMEMPIVSKIVGQWVSAATQILPAFQPLIKAGGIGMEAFTKNLLPAFTNPAFKQFLAQMAKAAPGVMGAGGKGLANLGEGGANLLQGFLPMVGVVDKGFVSMTESFNKWAQSLVSSQGFHNFIADAKKTLPEVAKLFGHVAAGVFSLVGSLLTLGVRAGPAFVGIVKGIGDVIKWVGMVVKSIAGWYDHMTGLNQFVSRALGSIAAGFGKLSGFISQIVGGLGRWLHAHWAQIVDDAEIAWNIVSSAIRIAWEVITSIIHGAAVLLVPALALVWSLIFNGVSIAWTIITSTIRLAVLGITDAIHGISDVIGFLTGVWKTVTSDISTAVGDIGKIFAGIVNAIESPFKTAIAWVVKEWNSTIGGFSFKVPGWVPGIGGDSIGVPKMALGGYLGAGQMALVGERGPELFVPSGSGSVVPNGQFGGGVQINANMNLNVNGANASVSQLQGIVDNALNRFSANLVQRLQSA